MWKNWVVTLGGIMVGLGTLPGIVTASHVAFPLYWNSLQFPLYLIGALGAILLGVSAKGADQHSTVAQVQQSTQEAIAKAPGSVVEPKP